MPRSSPEQCKINAIFLLIIGVSLMFSPEGIIKVGGAFLTTCGLVYIHGGWIQ